MGKMGRFSPFRDPSTRVGEVAAAIAAVFVLLAAYLVVSSGAASDAALRLTDGSVWLRSSQAGITLHDSGNGAVITALQTATGDDDFDVVQWQADALIVNSTTSTIARVDGTSWEIADALPIPASEEIKVFVGPAAAWRTSLGRIAEIDPTDLRAPTVEVPFSGRVHDGVVDAAGNLFLSTETAGIQLFRPGATEAEPVLDSEGVADMFQVGGVAAAVSQSNGSIWMDGQGIVCDNLQVPANTALHAEGSDELAVAVADSGFIHIWDPTDGCPTQPTSLNSGSFGDPVLADGWGVVPEYERSVVYLIDLDDRSVSQAEIQLDLTPGTEFELISENGTVWFNDPTSPTAGLIREDGTVSPISKYDPTNIDASFAVPEFDEDAVDEVLIQSLELGESAASAAEADVSSLATAEEEQAAEESSPDTTAPEDSTAEDDESDTSFAPDTTAADDSSEPDATTDSTTDTTAPDETLPGEETSPDTTDSLLEGEEEDSTDTSAPGTTNPDEGGETNETDPGPDSTEDTTPTTEEEEEEQQPGELSVKISGVSNPVVGETITYRAVVTGADAESITWSFTPDNTTGFGDGQEISTEFSVAGSVTISVTACSTGDVCDTSRSRLNVVEPEVEIPLDAKITKPSTATVGEPVTFRDVSTGEPEGREWFFQDGSPRTTSDQSPSVTFDSPGIKTITLDVERGDETDRAETTIEVVAVTPPVNLSLSCGQATAEEDTEFTCSVNAEARDAADSLNFDVSGPGTIVSESATNGTVRVQATGAGTIRVTAAASINGDSQTDSDTVTGTEKPVEVDPPNASITGASSTDIDESVTLRVNNSGGPIDGYSWTATGAAPSSGSSATFSPKWSTSGTKTVRLTVTQDGTSYDAGTHTVVVEDPPPTTELEERINDRRLTSDNVNWPSRSIAMFGGARAELETVVAGSADGFNANGISYSYSRDGSTGEDYREFTFIEYDAAGNALGRTRFRFFVSAMDGAGPNCPAVVFEFTGGPSASTNNQLKRANVSWSTSQAGISSYWVTSANGIETPKRTDSGNPQSNGSVVIGQSIYTGAFVPASGVTYTTHIEVTGACDGTTISSSVSWSVTYEDDGGGGEEPTVDINPVTNVACTYQDVRYVGTTLTWTERWTWSDVSEGEVGHRLPYSGGANEAAAGQQQTFVSGITGGINGSGGVSQIITLAPVGSTDASVSVSCQGSGGSWNPPAPPIDDPDTDGDGVPDASDSCPGTPAGTPVDANGCADTDGDGIPDTTDECPNDPTNTCNDEPDPPADTDGDGVPDASDSCPGTPAGTPVDANGCADTDGDGIPDTTDECPNDPTNTCNDEPDPPADTDGDGVPDASDSCPAEPGNPDLDGDGCTDPLDPPADGDGDGVIDALDSCVDVPGPPSNNGCPEDPPVDGGDEGALPPNEDDGGI